MKKKSILLLGLLSLTSCDFSYTVTSDFNYSDDNVQISDTLSQVQDKKAHIVLLYGQSNAEGVSSCAYLEQKDYQTYQNYLEGYDNVFINFYNGGGKTSSNNTFVKCELGFGTSSNYFGPEIGIAETMHYAYPDEMTFIIKWSYGGSALRNQWLDNHHNRGEMYNSAMDFTLKSMNYLINKGYKLTIDGICWMQGESDAFIHDTRAYYRDTVAFTTLLRHDLYNYQNEIKFIDACINDDKTVWPFAEDINDAKVKFSKESDLNYLIDTNAIGISTRTEPESGIDFAHYDSLSMVKLGQEFGKMLTQK